VLRPKDCFRIKAQTCRDLLQTKGAYQRTEAVCTESNNLSWFRIRKHNGMTHAKKKCVNAYVFAKYVYFSAQKCACVLVSFKFLFMVRDIKRSSSILITEYSVSVVLPLIWPVRASVKQRGTRCLSPRARVSPWSVIPPLNLRLSNIQRKYPSSKSNHILATKFMCLPWLLASEIGYVRKIVYGKLWLFALEVSWSCTHRCLFYK